MTLVLVFTATSKKLLVLIVFLAGRFSIQNLPDVPRKRLSKDLIDLLFPVPLYHASYSAGPGVIILKRVNK